MKSQFGIFLMYPLVIGIAILTMSDKSFKNETIDRQSSYAEIAANENLFYGPELSMQQQDIHSHMNPNVSTYHKHSVAFVKPRGFISFKEAVGFKESRGRYRQVNTLGYLGKYQFGMVTLNHFGVTDADKFLKSPELQEKVFLKYLNYNHDYLADYIEKYEGKTIGGVTITESGMLAAAHLSGPGGVRKFLNSNGTKSNRDAYGSSVKHYLKKFAGYDLKSVID
jgi:hypothetical protein